MHLTYSFGNLVRASLVAQKVKHPPSMWEPHVRSLGWEDPLQKRMLNHSSVLAWEISWTEELGGATIYGVANSPRRLNS